MRCQKSGMYSHRPSAGSENDDTAAWLYFLNFLIKDGGGGRKDGGKVQAGVDGVTKGRTKQVFLCYFAHAKMRAFSGERSGGQ